MSDLERCDTVLTLEKDNNETVKYFKSLPIYGFCAASIYVAVNKMLKEKERRSFYTINSYDKENISRNVELGTFLGVCLDR